MQTYSNLQRGVNSLAKRIREMSEKKRLESIKVRHRVNVNGFMMSYEELK